jgi:hypothetical protein
VQIMPGPVLNYAYDGAYRLTGVQETYASSPKWLVSAMTYNAHGGLTQMAHHGPTGSVMQTETRTYNTIGQLTRIQAAAGGGQPAVDLQYSFSATQNNGRIQSLYNAISGETVVVHL